MGQPGPAVALSPVASPQQNFYQEYAAHHRYRKDTDHRPPGALEYWDPFALDALQPRASKSLFAFVMQKRAINKGLEYR